MKAHIPRFMETVGTLAKKTGVSRIEPALQRGDGGFGYWVIRHSRLKRTQGGNVPVYRG